MDAPPLPLQERRMRRGEHLHLHLAAGTELTVLAGTVRLIEPSRWVGETATRLHATLVVGRVHRLTQHGPVALEAAQDARLQWRLPPPVAPRAPAAAGVALKPTQTAAKIAAPGWATGRSSP